MDSKIHSNTQTEVTNRQPIDTVWPFSDDIKCPGLTPGAGEIYRLAEELPKRLAIFSYKQSIPSLWLVFVGGTGTGKSTLFNAFCGMPLSETGVERPKTRSDCIRPQGLPYRKGIPL